MRIVAARAELDVEEVDEKGEEEQTAQGRKLKNEEVSPTNTFAMGGGAMKRKSYNGERLPAVGLQRVLTEHVARPARDQILRRNLPGAHPTNTHAHPVSDT